MTLKKILSALIAVLIAPLIQAADYSNAVFFGDSLSDSGSFLPILQADPTYNGAGKFTTNPGPVWTELLAAKYGVTLTPGNQGGTNYAEGGARISSLPGIGAFPASGATPIATQVQNYLTNNGGVADPNALYSLWGGANEIFWIAGGAVPTADITSYITTTTGEQVQAIGALQAAGARYVLVPVLPDIGATPFGVSQGPAGAASLTQLSQGYNGALLATLRLSGIDVIPVDMLTLLNEIQAQPTVYGFTNVTTPVCGTTPSLLCVVGDDFAAGLEQTYLYADGVHPTTGAHRIISDYVQSILMAPAFAQQVGRAARYQQRALIDSIDARLAQSTRQTEGSTELWISGEGGRGGAEQEGSRAAVGIGISQRLRADRSFGFGVHFSRDDVDLSGGSVETQSRSMSLFSSWQHAQWQWQSSLVVNNGDYDTRRTVGLGTAKRTVKGSTNGTQIGMQLGVNYLFNLGTLSHGPVARITYLLQSLSGFTENVSSGTATAMKYQRQSNQQITGNLGWQLLSNQGRWQPFAAVIWEQRLSDAPDPVSAALANMPDNPFALPSISEDSRYGQAMLGLNGQISEQVSLNGRLVRMFANDDSEETRLNLTVNFGF